MWKFLVSLVCAFFVLSVCHVSAAGLSVDDFIPPAQTNTDEAKQEAEKISQPEAVKEEIGVNGTPAIAAANAQDAINVAVERIAVGGGCEEIKFPSGFGFVASGVATYSVMPNPTATLSAQRLAYQIAYMNAKKSLAETLYGLSSVGREQLQEQFKTIISDTDTLSNTSQQYAESATELVKGLLRGYVDYKVNDEQTDTVGTVTVTIVATPKTMGKGSRVDSSSLTADSVKEGLGGVLAELSTGLLPPVGGKVISVPQSGELAFVGFGSSVVPDNADPAIRAKLALNAQKLAQMRARSALCGIILGDDIQAASSMDASTNAMSQQFEEAQKGDPVAENNDAATIAKLDEQRKHFLSTQFNSEAISSLRAGTIPPGVSVKTFFNPEKTMAEAVAVYLPSVTARAAKAGQDMKHSSIVQNPQGQGANEGRMPARGASGQVSRDEDL